MLKKEETQPGAIVEIHQLKDGLGGDKEHVLITPEAGSFLIDGGFGVTVGVQLEIVEAPKRRGGINTAVVKVLGDKRKIQGHVYWCELRASARLVKPAKGGSVPKKAKKNPNEFTEKQLARLPEHGYWVEMFNGEPTSFICVKNGKCKYTRPGASADNWYSLLWSCCPTAKQVAAEPDKYLFFAQHKELLTRFPDAAGAVLSPAPNDF